MTPVKTSLICLTFQKIKAVTPCINLQKWSIQKIPGVPKKVLCLINNRTKAFCSVLKISSVSDRCDINLDFHISFLKIRQILTELQELEVQNGVNHEISELFHLGCYMGVHVHV